MAFRLALFVLVAFGCASAPGAPSAPPKRVPPPQAKPAPAPAANETLAQCLKRKGIRLFGAHWCKPCHDQLALFGKDAPDVPYTDCQPEGTVGNIPECDALDIQSYPTWVFPDGYRAIGTRSLKWLATSADCPLR